MNSSDNTQVLGVMLVDIENLYLAIKNEHRNPDEVTIAVLQNLRAHLKDELGITPVVGRSYGPLDYSTSRYLINDLALMGITPVHVLARASKNSADLMLAIDAMEILFKRSDITTFVIVGGDRDYIPVVERIRQNARGILVVSPRNAMSGDLLTIIGRECYLDTDDLLPDSLREHPEPEVEAAIVVQKPAVEPATAGEAVVEKPAAEPLSPATETVQAETVVMPRSMEELAAQVGDSHELEEQKKLMKLILEFRNSHRVQEIWLGPFLREMNDAFPYKSNADRKSLLSRLCKTGAAHIVNRPREDEVGTYAVLMVNWEHPLVIEMNPG